MSNNNQGHATDHLAKLAQLQAKLLSASLIAQQAKAASAEALLAVRGSSEDVFAKLQATAL